MSGSYCGINITGFTAAPPGWRVVWLDDDEPGTMVTAPIAGWITGTDEKSGETVIEAATHCPGVLFGEAEQSQPCVYPVSGSVSRPGGVWKILAPGEPLPSPEQAAVEGKRRVARYEARQAREARRVS